MTLAEIANLVQFFAPPAFGMVAWYLRRLEATTQGVEDQLRGMNGRLLKMEEWRTMHDRQDEDREERARGDIRHVEEALGQRLSMIEGRGQQFRRGAT